MGYPLMKKRIGGRRKNERKIGKEVKLGVRKNGSSDLERAVKEIGEVELMSEMSYTFSKKNDFVLC